MMEFPEKGFEAPPVWEVALSVSTSGQVVDPYDIKGLHDEFRDELPRIERQSPVATLAVAALVGGPPAPREVEIPPARWWFIAENDAELLQVQESFIAANWRRQDTPPGARLTYPGFESLLLQARRRFKAVVERTSADVQPVACELLYDNLVPLIDRDGQPMALSEVLSEYERADEERKVFGFQMGWLERIDGAADSDQSILQVQASVVALPGEEGRPIIPLVKLLFTAAAVRSEWEEIYSFADIAHSHIRRRLMQLTTKRAQATWLPR